MDGDKKAPAPVALTPAQQYADELVVALRGVMNLHTYKIHTASAWDGLLKRARAVLAAIEATGQEGAAPTPVAQRPEPADGWVSAYTALQQDRDALAARVSYLETAASDGGAWVWQGDGDDHPESMVGSLPVIIRADQLRALIAPPAPVAQPLTAAQMGKCALESGLSWGTLSRLPDNLHKLTRAVERACAKAWGVKLVEATGQEGGA